MFFDIFKKNKKYISCEYLEHGIHFHVDGIFHCCCCFHSDANNEPVIKSTNNIDKDFNDFIKAKKIARNEFRKGNIIHRCKDCFHLKEKIWDNENIIKLLSITANKKCNCDCVYCDTHIDKIGNNLVPDLPVYDFILKLHKAKLIAADCYIDIGGGEPTIHFEFEKLLAFLMDITNTRICIHTSAVKYSNMIENLIKQNRANVVISIDSGNSDLYKKIKNVDKFDIVSENIKKYCQAQENTTELHQVALKYIILPEVNDKYDYMIEFLQHAKKLGCHAIRTDVESRWYKENMNNIDSVKYMLKLQKFLAINSQKKGFQHFFYLTANGLYNNNIDIYNSIEI